MQNYLTRGFWGDEAWTALISQFSIPEIIRITGEDFHPPFYYFLVHGFIQVFGASEWIRLISVLFWLLTPVTVYFLAKRLIGKGVAWVASILVLMSPILFTYAFEARAYALVAFISAASTLVFWLALNSKTWKWWLIYLFLGAVGVYTHYYMWFIFASHGVYWLTTNRKRFIKVLASFGGILLAQLPWVPKLFSQVSSVSQDYWIGAMDKYTHWQFFVRVSGGDFDTPQRSFTVWVVLILLILSPVLIWIKKKRLEKKYVYLWMWLLVPVILPTLISLYRPVFFYRYLIFSSIPILLIILWGLYEIKEWLAVGGAAFLLAFYLSINILSFQRYPHTMREEIGAIFEETPESEELKLVTVLPSFAEVVFYNQGRSEVQVLPLGLVQFSGKSLLDAFERKGEIKVAEVEDSESYWLIEPGPTSKFYSRNK